MRAHPRWNGQPRSEIPDKFDQVELCERDSEGRIVSFNHPQLDDAAHYRNRADILERPLRLNLLLKYEPHTGLLRWRMGPEYAPPATVWSEAHSRGYVTIDEMRLNSAHVVWFVHFGMWPRGYLKHVNGDNMDDRIENLVDTGALAPPRQDGRRKGRPPGVARCGAKWQAYHRERDEHGRTLQKHLGVFKTEAEAAAAAERYRLGLDLF